MSTKRPLNSSLSELVTKPQKLSTSSGCERETSHVFLGHFEEEKEWEEVRCPICLEHPHNAVLLICSSFEKGCRPYMCDTSRRHSNCLDQFMPKGLASNVVCPFCRGKVSGRGVPTIARACMNSKVRRCSLESCEFSGNYSELRKHARHEHPNSHPMEVNLDDQSKWVRLNQERDLGDARSMEYPSQFGFDIDIGATIEDVTEEMGILELIDDTWSNVLGDAYSELTVSTMFNNDFLHTSNPNEEEA